jgi:hypothetical protein
MADNNNKGAEQVILGVSLDTSQAEQQGQQLGNSLQGIGKNIGSQSVKSFKQQLKEAREEALRLASAGDTTSRAYQNAASRIAELRDAQDVLNRSVQAYDPGNRFAAVSKIASMAAQSVAGLTGAMTLFGVSSDTAAEAVAKLQSLQAIIGLLDTWDDSAEFLQSFIQRLGFAGTASEVVAAAQTAQATATESATAAMMQQTIVENDARIAALSASAATEARIIAETEAETLRLAAIGTTEAQVIAEQEQTIARLEGTVATETQTVATEGLTLAQKGAALASKALKFALASIGIGLIIAAVAYLVENWDSLKKSVTDLFPALNGAGELFTKVKNIAVGVGNAVVKFLIKPYSALYKLLTGDLKGAMNDIKSAFAFEDNFKAGKLIGEVADAKRKNKKILEDDIKTFEQKIKVAKAGGKDTEAMERAQYNRKKQLYVDDKEKFKEVVNDKEVFEAGVIKKANDKAKAEQDKRNQAAKAAADKAKAVREAELKDYEKYLEEARKITNQSTKNDRQRAEDDIKLKYKKELESADKLGKSKVEIEKAQAAELLTVNKKYANDVALYLAGKDEEKLSSFDKQRKQINDEINKLKETASADERAKLDASTVNQLSSIDNLEKATSSSNTANSNLDTVKTNNEANDKDKIEVAKQKILNIRNAEITAEMEAFNLKKLQLVGQKSEIEQLEKDHAQNLLQINTDTTKANLELSEKEKEQKISNMVAVSNMLGNAAALFSENTVAYKALAISQAGIDTYLSAQAAYKAMVGIPIVGPALGAVAAGVAVAGGLANIKKIVSVKVPNATSASSSSVSSAGAGFSAPTINSTILKQNDSGITNLTDTVNKKQENIRAYIVDDDLNKKQQKTDLISKMSTIG